MTTATKSASSTPAAQPPGFESAVEFPTPTRLHVAIAVKDVERSLPFYRTLFDQAPSKVRALYAKFEVHDPPVNFTLNAGDWPTPEQGPRHFGIQVKSTDAVLQAKERIEAAGFSTSTQAQVSCCYAVQDKVWVSDPDGHRWEIFVVTEAETDNYAPVPAQRDPAAAETDAPQADGLASEPEPCCAPSCCS